MSSRSSIMLILQYGLIEIIVAYPEGAKFM
jgi:hypothetical protein